MSASDSDYSSGGDGHSDAAADDGGDDRHHHPPPVRSDSDESDEEDTPLWARKAAAPPLRVQIGNYTVCYRDALIEAPPPKFDSMRDEFRMMNLQQRVVDWRVAELRRMQAHLEKKQKAREDEMEALDDNAETDVSGKKFVNTTILHSKYTKTYKATPIWDEKKWLVKHGKPSSFPQMLDLEQTRMMVVERVNLLRLETRAIREEITSLSKRAGGDAVTHLQRLVRGHLGRIYAVETRKRLAQARVQAAALQIQRVWRGSRARLATAGAFQELEDERRDDAAPPIQAVWRGYRARQRYKELEAVMRARQKQNMAVRIQAWYRGCAGRKVAEIVSQSRTKLQVEEDYLDSTVQIQRLLRGHLGRKKMRARKIEVQLNKRVKKLTYDYIGKGSFWEFLGAVNKDYERYNEQRVREEELASTFIHQVLEKREQQQKEAWQSWNIAKLASGKRGNAAIQRQRGKATGVYLANEGKESADEWMNKTMKTLNSQKSRQARRGAGKKRRRRGGGAARGGSNSMMSMMSGMVAGGGSALADQGRGLLNNHYGSMTSGGGGGGGGMSPMRALQLPGTPGGRGGGSNFGHNRSDLATPGGSFLSEEPSAIVIGGVSVPPDFGVGQTSRNKPFRLDAGGKSAAVGSYPGAGQLAAAAQEYAPLTSAIVAESSITNTNPEFFDGGSAGGGSSVNPFEFDRFPTDVLTLEITSKDEPVDRIVLHAALRTFIPLTSDAVTGEDAFREFLAMPRGLLKVQRESEVARFAQPYVKILKYAGMRTVESLKRATTTQLTALGLPSALAEVLCRLVRKLYRAWHKTKPGRVQDSVSGLLADQQRQLQHASSSLGGGARSSMGGGSRGYDGGGSGIRQTGSTFQPQSDSKFNESQLEDASERGQFMPHERRQYDRGRSTSRGDSHGNDDNSNTLPGDAPNIPGMYNEPDSDAKRSSSGASQSDRLGDAWPYDKNFDLRPASSGSGGNDRHTQPQDNNTGYENAMLLAGYPTRNNVSRGGMTSSGSSRPGTSATINYGSDSRPGTAMSLRDQLLSRGSSRGGMRRGSMGDRAVTPGVGIPRPGMSRGSNGRGRLNSRDAAVGGRPPTAPSPLKAEAKQAIHRSSSMPMMGPFVDPPTGPGSPCPGSPSADVLNQARPGTTGNLHISMRQHEGGNEARRSPTHAQNNKEHPSAVVSSGGSGDLIRSTQTLSQRPATAGAGASSLPPIGASPNRHATFQLLPPRGTADAAARGRLGSRGSSSSRPNTRGTLLSRGSNRPSTSATVDYGFAREFYQTPADERDAIGNIIPFEGEDGGGEDEDARTPRLRPSPHHNPAMYENPEEMQMIQPQQQHSGQHQLEQPQMRVQMQIQNHDHPHQQGPRPSTADELRRRLLAPMKIHDIDEPIENLIVGAAMQTYLGDDPESESDTTAENAFDKFIERLLAFPKGPTGERGRRELVRQRTRAMLRWVKPYLVTLRKQNLLTVRSIVEMGRPLEALALPVPIQEKLREVIGRMLPHSTASIGFDKRFQRSKLDAAGRPPPPADILNLPDPMTGKGGGVTPADQFYASHTVYPNYAQEFQDRPTRKRWPGSRIQVYPIPALESDFGRALPKPSARSKAPRSSVAERQRYKCRYPDCKCAFSRQYTLQLHERTHLYASDHYFWKHSKKIGEGMMNQDFAKAGIKFGQNGSVELSGGAGLSAKRQSPGRLSIMKEGRRKKKSGGGRRRRK